MADRQFLSEQQHRLYYDYILSNICFDDEDVENSVCQEIIQHKKFLDNELGRDAGIEVALVDYLKNINSRVHVPDILNSADIHKINHSGQQAVHPKAYDASVLSRDLEVEIERAHRYGSPFSIFLLDVLTTDTTQNEDILGSLSRSFSSHIRLTDSVYSYGKNRFVFLLSETSANSALQTVFNLLSVVVEPQRKKFKELDYAIGVAVFGQFHIDNDHKLLTAADKALTEALSLQNNAIYLYRGKEILEIIEDDHTKISTGFNQERTEIFGTPIQDGKAVGYAFIYNDLLSHELESYDIGEDALHEEYLRIKAALHKVEKELEEVEHSVNRELNNEHAAIFQAHRLIINDVEILEEIRQQLFERKVNAEEIIRDVFMRWEKRFLAFDDEIFRSKSQDIADISRRILRELQGLEKHILKDVPENSIIFSTRLLPSDTVHINRQNVKAIVTKEGGKFSHAAIIAKSLNIPVIVFEELELTEIRSGARIFLDGFNGRLVINPEENEYRMFQKQVDDYRRSYNEYINSVKEHQELSYMGEKIALNTVVSNLEESRKGIELGAEGIGLFRMEVLYMIRDSMPEESWLLEQFETILHPFKEKDIVIRLLDIGGDKTLSYLNVSERYNSFLGIRGIRLLIKYPKLLETQMRVCLELAKQYRIKLLVPMVTLTSDIQRVRNLYKHLKNALDLTVNIPIGAMIETPAAVIAAEEILEKSDFVSIGSNDLIQYTMAADREKLNVSQYFEQGNITVQKSIEVICRVANKKGISCSLCGDLAQNPLYINDLLKIGCRTFSVDPVFLPSIRQKVLECCNS